MKSKMNVLALSAFYFLLFLVALGVDSFEEVLKLKTSLWHVGVGAGSGLAIVLTSVLGAKWVPGLKELARTMEKLIGPVTWGEAFIIAAFSSLGEEFFFRGILQHYVGLVFTSILFGLLHSGPDKKYWPWTIFAILVGFLLGGLYQWTQNLMTPVTAHFLVNFLNLTLIIKEREVRT